MDTVVRGKAWTFGNDINTESIMRSGADWSAELAVSTCLKYYDPEFAVKVQKGDVIVAGTNFGNSSSRPAAEVLVFLGVSCIICESSARIFFRNTWNIGIPVLECPGITQHISKGDDIEVDIGTGKITNHTTGASAQAESPISLLVERWQAGGMIEYVKKHKEDYPALA
ncbi:MAG: 3-isopropylmalate dehydratase small subunit [Oscillospiraceae bacterium]|jgi:3-isopropylmalate/(R)-2-methylmalate dehydratase small subunit|nr:3-isopropylmalate dehydratase small subunit [Oscillospiraceae bacterium]